MTWYNNLLMNIALVTLVALTACAGSTSPTCGTLGANSHHISTANADFYSDDASSTNSYTTSYRYSNKFSSNANPNYYANANAYSYPGATPTGSY